MRYLIVSVTCVTLPQLLKELYLLVMLCYLMLRYVTLCYVDIFVFPA